jgi:hypothetical protein
MKFLLNLLIDFKFARRKLGGTWYYVIGDVGGGMQGHATNWTQKKPYDESEILKTEQY